MAGRIAERFNQPLTIGGSSASWDSKGNLTSDPTSGKTYGYSSENLLTSASGGVTLAYDPALRLYQVAGASTTRFAYDGVNAIAEYDGSNALQRRYVFGPGIDQPIVQYEGSGTSDRRFMGADERGSIVSLTDSSGALLNLNRYDEYGKPQGTNTGRFQYTGQIWLSELGAYHYKARIYLPHLGIFAQTDPIGYAGSPNLYAYVLNDPVNLRDPLGLQECDPAHGDCGEVVVEGKRLHLPAPEPASSNVGLDVGYYFGSNEVEQLANLELAQNTVKPPPAKPAPKPQPKPPSPPQPLICEVLASPETYENAATEQQYAAGALAAYGWFTGSWVAEAGAAILVVSSVKDHLYGKLSRRMRCHH